MAKKIIVIDPGHGGDDPGAISTTKRMPEKKINLNVALVLKGKLESLNPDYTVYLTRNDDKFVSLSGRGKFATKMNADLLISIHHNSATAREAKGFDVIYEGNAATHARSLRAAKLIAAEFTKMGQVEHRVFCKMGPRDPSEDWFGLMTSTKVPTVITEYAFLSNPEDEAKVDTHTEQWAEASAIAKGIDAYLRG